MATLKNLLLQICLGVVIGTAVVDLISPAFLIWYHIPGGGQALCNCADLVRSTAHDLVNAHLVGSGIGAILCLILGLLLRRRSAPDAVPPAASAPPSAAPPSAL
ncbi:MAG TPA: hypothetical protein VFH51_20610 [Myxococcota bacterium]|nr:hypothetical protein [Myxococcota bacterium]